MIAKEESLNGNFEYVGEWFRPESPQQRIHGTLEYSRGKMILKTTGSMGDEGTDFVSQLQLINRLPRLIPIVLGISTTGKNITLTNCVLVRANPVLNGLGTFQYGATTMFVGAHFQSVDAITFGTVSVQYSNLYAWMGRIPFRTDISGIETGAFRLEYQMPEIVRARINEEFTVEIAYGHTMPMFTVQEDFEINQKVSWVIKSITPAQLPRFMEILRCFRYFLMLAMLKTVHPLSIVAHAFGDNTNPIIIFPSIQIYDDIPKISMVNDMLFSFPTISDNFETYVQTWFALWGRLHHPLTTYFATLLDANRMTIEIQFQRIAEVMESYHREKYPNERGMPEEEYNAMIEDMKSKLSANSREVSFVSRFKSMGNGPSLEQRILQLVDLNPRAFNNVANERAQFASNVMNTRNYHAHGIEELRERAITDVHNLIYLTYQMLALMESCLLTELPFPEGTRNELIVKNRNVRNYAREHQEQTEDED
ncbi:MAG: HEPN domain-containing protein [Nitrosotalea sp.]